MQFSPDLSVLTRLRLFVEVCSICTLSVGHHCRVSALFRLAQGDSVTHRGTQEITTSFIDVFDFVQEDRKVKIGPEANALIH